jgi:hypothetical protein
MDPRQAVVSFGLVGLAYLTLSVRLAVQLLLCNIYRLMV